MARVLRILSLRLRTSKGWQEPGYDLDAQVVAIVGPADTGKSSFLDAIAYGLGAEGIRFKVAVRLHLREVELKVRLGNRTYALRRARSRDGVVEVRDEVGDLEGRFQIKPKDGSLSMSAWLLSELGLAEGFASTGGKLDFFSGVLPFCYLNQNDIDRHIVLPPSEDAIRLAAMRLMLGMTDSIFERQVADLKRLGNEIKSRQRTRSVIAEFLSGSPATSPAAVAETIRTLAAEEAQADARLAELRAGANAAVTGVEHWKQRRYIAQEAVDAADERLTEEQRRLRATETRVIEVEDALEALNILEGADPADRTTLELITEKRCPDCDANILVDVPPPGHCALCRRLLRGHRHLATRIQLQSQLQDASDGLPALEKAVREAEAHAGTAREELAKLLTIYHEQTQHAVTPHVDALTAAAAELASIRQRLTDMRQIEAGIQRHEDEVRQIKQLRADYHGRRASLETPESSLLRSAYVTEALTDIFRGIVADIGLPNFTGRARIDADELLPYVDEQPFDARGSGARAAVSVAYSLALLSFTLEDDTSDLPGLLMIDSPQKNLGANDSDQGLAKRVYEKFIDAMQIRGTVGDGRFERPFQLIVADNDRPSISGLSIVHEFKYGDGLIKDLADPHGIPETDVLLPFDDAG